MQNIINKSIQKNQKYMKTNDKNHYDLIIIGSGIGGLATACWVKQRALNFLVIEINKELMLNLKYGVHYLHTIPDLPFDADLKSIVLTDGILKEDGTISHTPNLKDVLEYSEKVREIQHPSSIFEVGKRDKVFIPKSNSLDNLILSMYEYAGPENFLFDTEVCNIDLDRKILYKKKNGAEYELECKNIVSTIPIGKLLDLTPNLTKKPALYCRPIRTVNVKVNKIVPNWLINLYVPSLKEKVYRASILNNTMSVESVDELNPDDILNLKKLFKMFYLDVSDPIKYEWKQGKIISISMDERRALIEKFLEKDIYTIGRFGLWNNKLLMDATIGQAKSVIDCITKPIDKKELIKKLSI